MSESIKRYITVADACMEPDGDGEWVRFDDPALRALVEAAEYAADVCHYKCADSTRAFAEKQLREALAPFTSAAGAASTPKAPRGRRTTDSARLSGNGKESGDA
jgi:hypothetical protein